MQGKKNLVVLAEMLRLLHATKTASKAPHFASPNALGVVQAVLLNLQGALAAPEEALMMLSKARDAPGIHTTQVQKATPPCTAVGSGIMWQ